MSEFTNTNTNNIEEIDDRLVKKRKTDTEKPKTDTEEKPNNPFM